MRCLLVVVIGLSTQVINKPSALNGALSLHYYNLTPSMEHRTGSTFQVVNSYELRFAQTTDFSHRAAGFSAINLSRACSIGSQRFTESSCLPTTTSKVARFSELRTARAADSSDRAAEFSATNLSRARGIGSEKFIEPSCSLETNASRPLFDTTAFFANN